jgi:hypothetical protein
MTKTQTKFYNMLKNQMVDFEEIFHKEFMIQRIEKINDNDLKYLLEDIYNDNDRLSRKGYITYAKFIHYADKFTKNIAEKLAAPHLDKVEELYNKRQLLLSSIEKSAKSIADRNRIINDIENKKLMFNQNGKNILDECDYYIIKKFGFYQFFDENRNYHIKEEIERYLKEYYQAIAINDIKYLKQ